MSKVLKVVGTIAGAVALVATAAVTFGGSAFAATAIGGALGGAGGIAAVSGIIAGVANIGSQLLYKPPPARGSVTQVLIAPDAPTPYVMGEGYFAGVLRHDAGYGATLKKIPNPYRWMVSVYSTGGPIDSITPMVELAGVGSWYSGFLYTDTQLGACPEASALAPNFAGAPGWPSTAKLNGLAAIGWNLKFDKDGKVFASGVPRLGASGKWVKVYDPRKDSTFPGGSGAHRLGDEATYEWSENPALHAGTYAFGRYQNGKRVFGIGMPVKGVDWTGLAAWANICDANSWSIFGVIYEPGNRWDNLKEICAAGGCTPVFANGLIGWHYSAPKVALDTITDADIADYGYNVTAMTSWRDRMNSIRPKYRSATHDWELVTADAVTADSFVIEDGELKQVEWPFNLVREADQAAQLGTYKMWDSREFQPITLTCLPRLRDYRPGECLHITLPELDLDTDAIILTRELNPATMAVTFTLIGETPGKHDYALGRTATPPATPALKQTVEERDELRWAVVLDASYADSTPYEDLKPAEVGATEGAVVPAIGSGVPTNVRDQADVVLPISELRNSAIALSPAGVLSITREAGAPTTLGQVRVADLGASSLAAQRTADDALARLAAVVTNLNLAANQTRLILRDAGIYVDPATGAVKLSAVDEALGRTSDLSISLDALTATVALKATTTYVDNSIALAVLDPSQVPVFTSLETRIHNAEVELDGIDAALLLKADAVALTALTATVTTVSTDLDALEGVVATKVATTTFDTLATRVTIAEETLSAIGDTASLVRGVEISRSVSRDQEALAAATLQGLIDGDAAQRREVAAQATAREEIIARMVEVDTAEAIARQTLAAEVDTARADIASEQIARSDGDSALASAAALLTTRVGTAEASIAEQAQSIDGLSVSSVRQLSAQRGLERDVEAAAAATLQGVVDADAAQRAAAAQSARAFEETVARLVAGDGAEALARRELEVRVSDAEAGIASESTARVNGDEALASTLDTLTTEVDGNTASIAAQATSINGVRARYTLKLDVGGRVTGMVWDAASSSTTVDWIADAFRLWVPTLGAARQVFEASATGVKIAADVEIDGSLVVTGTINAGRLATDGKSVVDSGGQLTVQQVVVAPPAGVTIYCDHSGAPKSGQLTKILTPVVTRGGSDVRTSNDVSYAITAPSSLAASINNTNGSADKGRITIDTGWSAPGTIQLTATVDGKAFGPFPIAVARQNDPAPTTGGGSGGTKSASDSSFTSISSASFTAISDELTVDVATGESVRVTAPLDYAASAIGNISGVAMVAKAQHQPASGGAWTDFPSSPVTGTNATWNATDFSGDPGSIALDQTQGGLSAGAYKIRLVAALSVSTGSPTMNVQSGTMNVAVQ